MSKQPAPIIRFRREGDHGLPLPSRASSGAGGIDLCATASLVLQPGQMETVGTGFAVEIPSGHVGLVRGRSGLAFRRGVFVFDGTIDCDFRGEVHVLIFHCGVPGAASPLNINRGDRIAQLVVVPVVAGTIIEAGALSETERDRGGFGSTGV